MLCFLSNKPNLCFLITAKGAELQLALTFLLLIFHLPQRQHRRKKKSLLLTFPCFTHFFGSPLFRGQQLLDSLGLTGHCTSAKFGELRFRKGTTISPRTSEIIRRKLLLHSDFQITALRFCFQWQSGWQLTVSGVLLRNVSAWVLWDRRRVTIYSCCSCFELWQSQIS